MKSSWMTGASYITHPNRSKTSEFPISAKYRQKSNNLADWKALKTSREELVKDGHNLS